MTRSAAIKGSEESRARGVRLGFRVIARHKTMLLSARDREVFFDTLVNPPEPPPRLRRAFEAEHARIEP